MVNKNLINTHPSLATLEFYSLRRLARRVEDDVEGHLLACVECAKNVTSLERHYLALMDLLRHARPEVHATEDGLIYNWVEVLGNGQFGARHRGPLLDGGDDFATKTLAWKYLHRSFADMFPEHPCSGMPLRGRSNRSLLLDPCLRLSIMWIGQKKRPRRNVPVIRQWFSPKHSVEAVGFSEGGAPIGHPLAVMRHAPFPLTFSRSQISQSPNQRKAGRGAPGIEASSNT